MKRLDVRKESSVICALSTLLTKLPSESTSASMGVNSDTPGRIDSMKEWLGLTRVVSVTSRGWTHIVSTKSGEALRTEGS